VFLGGSGLRRTGLGACAPAAGAGCEAARAAAGTVGPRVGGRTPTARWRACHVLAAGAALALVALQPTAALAHETDQYTLPLGREFADVRIPLSSRVRDAIVEAVKQTNAAIRRSLRYGHPTDQTLRLQSADGIAGEVWAQLFAAFPTNEGLDKMLATDAMRARYPGLVTVYMPERAIYGDALLVLDLTKLIRTLFRGATVKVDGTLFGTDKIIHFVHLGRIYHSNYLDARKRGQAEDQAVAEAVQLSAGLNPFLSENALLGMVVTGIRSNGDLAANYAGFKFYRNLTEEVRIGDRIMPPMLNRDGPYWRVGEQVRAESDFFSAFITPHFNEALNPNTYAVLVDARVRSLLADRCRDVVNWYRDEQGQPRDREQFEQIHRALSTFYGEDYGCRDDGAYTVSIATTCFPSSPPASAPAAAVSAAGPGNVAQESARAIPVAAARARAAGVDRLGRTELWWAARHGRHADVERLLARGEAPNAADLDGETPLHAAARGGHGAVVEALLAQGADASAADVYRVTPLHVAVQYSQPNLTRVLLSRGADANARNLFGASPLHDAALQGNRDIAALLLDHGADPAALDDSARTPLQRAMRAGDPAFVQWFSSYIDGGRASPGPGRGREEEASSGRTALVQVSAPAGAR
jgi:hypothetical protein